MPPHATTSPGAEFAASGSTAVCGRLSVRKVPPDNRASRAQADAGESDVVGPVDADHLDVVLAVAQQYN
jgi:hypothetical protein